MRDIQADYKAAYLAEYEGYKAAGRDQDAARVADILRNHFGHDVDAEAEPVEHVQRPDPGAQETTALAPPPEAVVEPKPTAKTAAPRKTAAKKAAAKAADGDGA